MPTSSSSPVTSSKNVSDSTEQWYYFLVRSYQAWDYFDICIDSILAQDMNNYTIIFIDDYSSYNQRQKQYIRDKLQHHVVVFNKKRRFAVQNAYHARSYITNPNSVVISLDGDDWLARTDVLAILDSTYSNPNCQLTYGDCYLFNPNSTNHRKSFSTFDKIRNHRYPKNVEQDKSFRQSFFRPFHLKSWRAGVFLDLPKHSFTDSQGKWLRFCEDQAILYPLLEHAGSNYTVLSIPLSYYNADNPLNDQKVNLVSRLSDEIEIRGRHIGARHSYSAQTTPTDHLTIKYSPLLAYKFAGSLLYVGQFLAVKLGFKKLWMARGQQRVLKLLLRWTDTKSKVRVTYPIGMALMFFSQPVKLDIGLRNWQIRDESEYQAVLWTLLSSSSATKQTYRSISRAFGSVVATSVKKLHLQF